MLAVYDSSSDFESCVMVHAAYMSYMYIQHVQYVMLRATATFLMRQRKVSAKCDVSTAAAAVA
jgi:hypothetical protein